VESVLTQVGPAVRVLIIDDASPDDTAAVAGELLREDKRVYFVRHAANKGHIATYNEGIDWVSADYLLLLSADDYLLPGALGRSVNLMNDHPEVGFIFGNCIQLGENGATAEIAPLSGQFDNVERHIFAGSEFIELCGSTNVVPTPTAVIRTTLQKQVGGYRPELPHSGDMEMWLRLADQSCVGFIGASQAVYRKHGGNMSTAYFMNNWLPDLRQRKAALQYFFQNGRTSDPRLRQKMCYSLGCEAVGFASSAFDSGELAISQQLLEFAVEVCPEVKESWRWRRFTWQRRLGSRTWRALRAAATVFTGPGSKVGATP
jgi:glycosyltransferase involved in cell wall biosynthesis